MTSRFADRPALGNLFTATIPVVVGLWDTYPIEVALLFYSHPHRRVSRASPDASATMADPSEAPAPGDNGPAVPQPDISALLSMLQQGPSDAAGAPPPQSAHAPPAAADFYDPLAGAPPAAPPNAFAAQPRADGSADEYRFNPHHKVHFSSPPSVMFSLPNDSRLFVGNLASEKTSPCVVSGVP